MESPTSKLSPEDEGILFTVRFTVIKVYCEDDYFIESLSEQQYHLKCDRTLQLLPEAPLPFKYSRFNEYLKKEQSLNGTTD